MAASLGASVSSPLEGESFLCGSHGGGSEVTTDVEFPPGPAWLSSRPSIGLPERGLGLWARVFCAPKATSSDSRERSFAGEAGSFKSGFLPPAQGCVITVSALGLLGGTTGAVTIVKIAVVVTAPPVGRAVPVEAGRQ